MAHRDEKARRDYKRKWYAANRDKVNARILRWTKAKITQFREALIKDMGGVCKKCGADEDLEFHHPHGREYMPRKIGQLARLQLYRKDWEAGELELLCEDCHKATPPVIDDKFKEEIPF